MNKVLIYSYDPSTETLLLTWHPTRYRGWNIPGRKDALVSIPLVTHAYDEDDVRRLVFTQYGELVGAELCKPWDLDELLLRSYAGSALAEMSSASGVFKKHKIRIREESIGVSEDTVRNWKALFARYLEQLEFAE